MIDKSKKKVHFKIDTDKVPGYYWDTDCFNVVEITRLHNKFVAEFGADPDSVFFEHTTSHGHYDEINHSLVITGHRWETDAEYELRMSTEKAARARKAKIARINAIEKIEREKAEYQRLKTKFENLE